MPLSWKSTALLAVFAAAISLAQPVPVAAPAAPKVSGGVVQDAKGAPIPNAKVVYRKDDKIVAEVKADANGVIDAKVNIGEDFEVTILRQDGVELFKKIVRAVERNVFKVDAAPAAAPPPPPVFQDAKGKVEDGSRNGIANARITIRSGEQTTVVSTGKDGAFAAKVPNEKSYEIGVEANGYSPVTLKTEPQGIGILHVVLAKGAGAIVSCCDGDNAKLFRVVILFSLLIYLVVAAVARYHNIVRVDREIIRASLQGLEQEHIQSEEIRTRVKNLLKKARATLGIASGSAAADQKETPKESPGAPSVWLTFLFGFRGEEVAARTNVCDARLVVAESYTREQILSRLRMVVETLRPDYSNVAAKVDAVLEKINTAEPPSTEYLRATLIDAMRASHEKVELADFGVMNWQNKAFTFIFLGCCLLIAMAWVLANPVLIFLGLLGGFASRLLRGKTENSSDGSLSWTTLLLSPLYGAFAGWAGILLLTALTSMKALGESFAGIVWEQASCSNISLGLAFLLGFSERFFSAVSDMAENAVTKRKNASSADTPESKPSPSDPKAGIPVGVPAAAANATTQPVISAAALSEDGLSLLLKGTDLSSVKEVRLQGVTAPLAIARQSATDLEAKLAAKLASGRYIIQLNGVDSSKFIVVP
jgi:hypothetical protein